MITDGVPRRAATPVASVDASSGPLPRKAPLGCRGRRNWPSWNSELRVAELRPVPELLGCGLPDRLPWQAWLEHRPAVLRTPKCPLDWRAVTLRWDEDGIWWPDFKKNYTRPFFTPYPFGICLLEPTDRA